MSRGVNRADFNYTAVAEVGAFTGDLKCVVEAARLNEEKPKNRTLFSGGLFEEAHRPLASD